MTSISRSAFALALTLTAASPAHADAVAEWNRVALDTVTASSRTPQQALQALATVHVAMFEALNFVEQRYPSQYTVASRAQPGVPRDAVAAAAAHHILVELYPARSAALDRTLKKSLEAIADPQAAHAGAVAGKSIAQIVWAIRASDRTAGLGERTLAASARMNGNDLGRDIDPRIWNSAAESAIASKNLDPVESARIHALVSGAAVEVHRTSAYPTSFE